MPKDPHGGRIHRGSPRAAPSRLPGSRVRAPRALFSTARLSLLAWPVLFRRARRAGARPAYSRPPRTDRRPALPRGRPQAAGQLVRCPHRDMLRRPRGWGFFELHPGLSRVVRSNLAYDLRRGLCNVPGYSPPRGKLLRTLRLATSHADRSLRLDYSRSALLRDVSLPAPTRLCFRVGAYHLGSRRPCPSAAGLNLAARYDVLRSATSLGEYCSLNCADPKPAALDTARDVRCGH